MEIILVYYITSKSGNDGEVEIEFYKASSSIEPASDSVDNQSALSQINGILNTTYSNSKEFGLALQSDYNKMIERVDSTGGFWIGRYETSGMSNETTTTYNADNNIKVKVIKGTMDGIGDVSWHRKYAQQKAYSNNLKLTYESNMIWGCQWDQVMIWLKDIDNTKQNTKYILNCLGMDNVCTGRMQNTGCYSKVKNIYNLGGNEREATMESNPKFTRGKGIFTNQGFEVYTRSHFDNTNTGGTRLVIY